MGLHQIIILLSLAASSAEEGLLDQLGKNATKRLRATMRDDRSVDVLGVRVRVGCNALVRPGNATIQVKCGPTKTSYFDLRHSQEKDLERCGDDACGHGLWRLRSSSSSRQRSSAYGDAAFLTSVSDLAYLWKYWRWILNKLCVANAMNVRYYLWVGAPVRGRERGGSGVGCPARLEEPLAHTTKALSLYLTLTLAKRVIFLDADAWFYSIEQSLSFLTRWIEAARDARLALPAPCYKQFFGAAVVMVTRSDWTFGFLNRWYDLRCGPKDQPSLWALVLRDGEMNSEAERVLELYQDPRCLNENGDLTKNECSCENCGYYAAWTYSNGLFKDSVWPSAEIQETQNLYQVSSVLFLPHVAYLPNVGSLSLLCGQYAVVGHIKFLRKEYRDIKCEIKPPHDALFKGPRDNV